MTSLLWALIIQRIFSIPTDSLLLTFLEYSKDLREFCGFSKVPDASKITRFKQEFTDDLQLFFDSLVDLTEPILQEIDAEKASMSVFDTTGLEAYVTENNPKYANQKIRQLKAWPEPKDWIPMTPIKLLMDPCQHMPLPMTRSNSSILTDIFAMLTKQAL